MARIRTIKPQFWEDEKIASLPFPCRLFFIGTWTHADDNGVIRANASVLKSKIFPYDDSLRVSEVSKWIDSLVNARMLVPINHKGESYYVIRTFHSHQKFDARYPNYLIPKEDFELLYMPDEYTAGTQRVPDGATTREGEGEREREIITPNGVVELWNSTCRDFSKVEKLTDGRKRKINTRLGEMGKTNPEKLQTLQSLFEKIQASAFLKGDSKTQWKAGFDWVFENDKNWVKVMEGNYDGRPSKIEAVL